MAAKNPRKKPTRASTEGNPAQPPCGTPEAAVADLVESQPERPAPPVAGIGASAGGLEAFQKFFTAMPPDSGIAFALVPHLDPAHDSLMVELLARHTPMPVVEAENDMPVEANHVYIIPPNKYMTIHGGILRLTGPVQRHTSQTSIDLFLCSLADDQQERSICIILSGTGAHGTLGLKAIKAAGGMAMVQDPATAEYPRMPQSAVATGLADYVLPVERMPAILLKYVQHGYLNGGTRIEAGPEAADQWTQVLALLRTRSKIDFRCYRKKMLMRRIERRMGLNHFEDLHEYVAFLRDHPQELKQLVKDLCISITRFFRDPEAFAQLASQVLAPLVQRKEAGDVIRVWVPGCSTGEEAYSIAILLREQQAEAHKSCRVQIFATDVDEDALDVARRGLYPESISADLSPERLEQFFVKQDGPAYQVNKPVRDIAIFAVQNLINDPPFTKLDLICCRNLLIYLDPQVQKKIVTLFHFALNEGGFLVLGSSETIRRQTDLFEQLSKKWRIYRRIGPTRPERVDFPIAAAMEVTGARRRAAEEGGIPSLSFAEVTQQLLLEQFAPAAVLIDRKYEILYYFGPCTLYLEFPTGDPTHDVTRMARNGLSSRLRGAIHRAIRDNECVVLTSVRVKRNSSYALVRVTIRPVPAPKAAGGLLLITFQEEAPFEKTLSSPGTREQTETGDDSPLRQLENELKVTRDDLQSTIKDLETSNEHLRASNEEILSMNEEVQSANEELKASNEEVLSMNEELQSTNEELRTSRTELQALNEELGRVNAQLNAKVQELKSANDDMSNLLHCTDVATLFLDRAFRIKLFTPEATHLFSLIPADIGRPLGDITTQLHDPDLFRDAQQVLQQLTPREKEVSTAEGAWWVRRIMVYRTQDNRIDGVVITFVDITERKKTADAVVRRLAAIVESSIDAIFSKDLEGIIQTWNYGAERLYGYTAEEAVGRSAQRFVPKDRTQEWEAIMARLRRGENIGGLETEHLRKDGQRVPIRLTISLIRDSSGKVVSASAIARDISESKSAERNLRNSEERLRAIYNTAVDAILTIDQRGIIQSANPATERMFGYTAAEMIGQNVKMLMPSPYREEHDGYLAHYQQTREKHVIDIGREVEARRKDDSVFPVDLAVSEIEHLKLFTGILHDLTHRKRLEHEVVEIASLEQRRIGHDLHDSVGQELTALRLLARDLAETVQTNAAKASPLVEQMIQGLQRSQQELRGVLRGLLPVAVDTEGLMAALADLAHYTQREGKVSCLFDCSEPVPFADNLIATHLYLITQEAVHNAVKHARATEIRISLQKDGGLVLRIQDDGIGMPAPPAKKEGLGLRIMQNRAAIIGAKLTFEPAQPTGTLVTCILPRKHHEP